MTAPRKRAPSRNDAKRVTQMALGGDLEAASSALAAAAARAQLPPRDVIPPAQQAVVAQPLTPAQIRKARAAAERAQRKVTAEQAARDAAFAARTVIAILHDSRRLVWARDVPLLARTVDTQPWEATVGRMLTAQFKADPMMTPDWVAAVIVLAVSRKRGPLKLYKGTFEELVTKARADTRGTRVELLHQRRTGVIEVWVGGSKWRDIADLDPLDDPDEPADDDPTPDDGDDDDGDIWDD